MILYLLAIVFPEREEAEDLETERDDAAIILIGSELSM